MNVQANPISGSIAAVDPIRISLARRFYWALRRELWESRYLYMAPLVAAAVVLIGFPFHALHFETVTDPYDIAGGFIFAISILVAVFYCTDALYGERRDRSILFWKSLPVSDSITVLTKATVALIIVPLIGFAIAEVTEFIMLLIHSAIFAASGQSVALLWARLPLMHMSLLLLYHVMTVHVLWPAPLFCWILLVSAWAKRAPFLWAFVPPVAIVYLERATLNTRHFLDYLQYRLMGNGMEAITPRNTFPSNPLTHPTPWLFLTSFGLWAGLAVAAIFLAIAIRLRRSQGPA